MKYSNRYSNLKNILLLIQYYLIVGIENILMPPLSFNSIAMGQMWFEIVDGLLKKRYRVHI